MWFILTYRKENIHYSSLGTIETWLEDFFFKNGTYLNCVSQNRCRMNVRHLQAHVPCLLSHMSEFVLTQFFFGGYQRGPAWNSLTLAPFSQLKYDHSAHLIIDMSGL
jgi:hypothetical protein